MLGSKAGGTVPDSYSFVIFYYQLAYKCWQRNLLKFEFMKTKCILNGFKGLLEQFQHYHSALLYEDLLETKGIKQCCST